VTNDESDDIQSEEPQEDNGSREGIKATYEEWEMEERKDNCTPK